MDSQLECKLRIDSIFRARKEMRFNQAIIDAKFAPIWEAAYPGLYQAIEAGDLERVVAALPSFASHTIISTSTTTTTAHADISQSIITFLISKCHASGGGRENAQIVDYLCERIRGSNPLSTAISNGLMDVFQLLFERGHFINAEIGLFELLYRQANMTKTVNPSKCADSSMTCLLESMIYSGLETPINTNTAARLGSLILRTKILCLFKILYHKFIFLNFESIFDLTQTLLCEMCVDFQLFISSKDIINAYGFGFGFGFHAMEENRKEIMPNFSAFGGLLIRS
jgi:hypothetical protein